MALGCKLESGLGGGEGGEVWWVEVDVKEVWREGDVVFPVFFTFSSRNIDKYIRR